MTPRLLVATMRVIAGVFSCALTSCGQGLLTTNGTYAERTLVVLFPDRWMARHVEGPHRTLLPSNRDFSARKVESRSNTVILTMTSPIMEGGSSAQFYSLSFEPSMNLTPASRADWDAATTMEKITAASTIHRRSLVMHSGEQRQIAFEGRDYAGRGSAFIKEVFPSEDHRWLAVLSTYEKTRKHTNTAFGFIAGGGMPSGKYFLDIFDTRTGKITTGADLRGDFYFGDSSWFGSNLFLVPLDLGGNSCVVVCLGNL